VKVEIIEFNIRDRSEDAQWTVWVDASEMDASELDEFERAGFAGSTLHRATVTFEEALGGIKPVAHAIVGQIKDLEDAPEEVEVTFGIKLTGSATLKIVASGLESHFQLKLKWTKKPEPTDG
jgi:inner membrane protein involved in colicin E2 resistance